ncbi:MAG: DNA-binding response regulator [Leptolyngbya sp. PLA1]|nr:DNA-binding response regulator [Leptolyngbya sp. PLA1]
MKTTLVIADDHEILRDALASHAASLAGFDVLQTVDDAQSAIHACRVKTPDMLLLDIEMPGRDALASIKDVRAVSPRTKVVILSAYCRDAFIDLAITNGADGYLVKSDSPGAIFEALSRIAAGTPAYSKSVLARLQPTEGGRGREKASEATRLAGLTPREIEVLRYIGRGLDNRQMATEMCISGRTVERHVSRLMDAVGIRDRAGLMKFAYEQGLVV